MNRALFIKAYHNRVYAFSSGTKFSAVCGDLKKWLNTHQRVWDDFVDGQDDGVISTHTIQHTLLTRTLLPSHQGAIPYNPQKLLKRLVDEHDLYKLLGDAVILFMRKKPEPFLSNALGARDCFWRVPPWKRAMTFVFMLRFLLGMKSQQNWKKFSEQDYKLNKRSFQRWLEKENEVFQKSEELMKLPEFFEETTEPTAKQKKRPRSQLASVSELSSEQSPMKRTFVIADESTSDSES